MTVSFGALVCAETTAGRTVMAKASTAMLRRCLIKSSAPKEYSTTVQPGLRLCKRTRACLMPRVPVVSALRPEISRTDVRVADRPDALDVLDAVLDRNGEPKRRSVLPRQRLVV